MRLIIQKRRKKIRAEGLEQGAWGMELGVELETEKRRREYGERETGNRRRENGELRPKTGKAKKRKRIYFDFRTKERPVG
ncbi:MAG: hypothetical protein WCQ90_14830 [Deltaproteobacteria bacterium]